jgi:CheY-like chemotaxis protein
VGWGGELGSGFPAATASHLAPEEVLRNVSHPRRILVVEDDDDIRLLLTELLAAEGYETRGASDGPQALELAESWGPDVVLLDLVLPSMDGWVFLGKLRASTTTIRPAVVVLSAKTLGPEDWAELPGTAVVTKPFDVDALMDAVNQAVKTR